MMVAARDEDGTAVLICTESDVDDTHLAGERGGRFWETNGYRMLTGDDAFPFCRNIPPGEKRVIDLEKSTIVHVAPPKTAVEELVEKLGIAFKGVCRDDLRITGCVGIDNKKAADVFDALARVRQEGGV